MDADLQQTLSVSFGNIPYRIVSSNNSKKYSLSFLLQRVHLSDTQDIPMEFCQPLNRILSMKDKSLKTIPLSTPSDFYANGLNIFESQAELIEEETRIVVEKFDFFKDISICTEMFGAISGIASKTSELYLDVYGMKNQRAFGIFKSTDENAESVIDIQDLLDCSLSLASFAETWKNILPLYLLPLSEIPKEYSDLSFITNVCRRPVFDINEIYPFKILSTYVNYNSKWIDISTFGNANTSCIKYINVNEGLQLSSNVDSIKSHVLKWLCPYKSIKYLNSINSRLFMTSDEYEELRENILTLFQE